eukprot:s298_g10.t1
MQSTFIKLYNLEDALQTGLSSLNTFPKPMRPRNQHPDSCVCRADGPEKQ